MGKIREVIIEEEPNEDDEISTISFKEDNGKSFYGLLFTYFYIFKTIKILNMCHSC